MNFLKKKIEQYSKTVGPRTEIDDVTTGALILQRAFGQQVLDPNWTWKRFYFHHFLSLFLFIYIFFGTLEILKSTTDVELAAEASYTLIMIIIFPTKLLLFINNRTIFRELYVTVKTTLFADIKADWSFTEVLRKSKKIVYFLYAIVVIPASNYELTALWGYVNGKRILLSRSTATLMPMTSPFYELGLFFHTVFLIEMSTTIIFDMWFVLLIYFLCAASDSLVKKLEIKREHFESKTSYGRRLNESLRSFYRGHVKHVQFLNSLNSMYKWLAFVPLCNAAICVCIMLLVLSKEVNWMFLPHIMPMFAEIFAYNWFGEQVKAKAAKLNAYLLNFDWTNLEVKDRINYYIIITYAKKNVGVKIATGDLSLVTMSAVLKASYQAFTVLQSVGD